MANNQAGENMSANANFTSTSERFSSSMRYSESLTQYIIPRNLSMSYDISCRCISGSGSLLAMTVAWSDTGAAEREDQSCSCISIA